jgi:hypothetical protein
MFLAWFGIAQRLNRSTDSSKVRTQQQMNRPRPEPVRQRCAIGAAVHLGPTPTAGGGGDWLWHPRSKRSSRTLKINLVTCQVLAYATRMDATVEVVCICVVDAADQPRLNVDAAASTTTIGTVPSARWPRVGASYC